MQVAGPALPALRQFAARLLANPQAVWPLRVFGALDAMPSSAWAAFAAPVSHLQTVACFCPELHPSQADNHDDDAL